MTAPPITALLYSDQIIPANAKLDTQLTRILRPRGSRIGYVASGPEPGRRFFIGRQAYYARLGLTLDCFVDPEAAADPVVIARLFDCDAIHLAGGDTEGFLRWVTEAGLTAPLRDWARGGGVLIGASAGALLMTPSIALTALYDGRAPEAVPAPEALALLPFEVFCHLNTRPGFAEALIARSARIPHPIAACRDGDGIVVEDGRVTPLGEVLWFAGGARVEDPFEDPAP